MIFEIKYHNDREYKKHGDLQYATPGSCAVDLRATVAAAVRPGDMIPMDTGVSIHLGSGGPSGAQHRARFAGLLLPRSGLSRRGLVLGNSVGLIDEDYTGPLIALLWNRNASGAPVVVKQGERIAQLMIVLAVSAEFKIVQEFSAETERGSKGFGDSGRI